MTSRTQDSTSGTKCQNTAIGCDGEMQGVFGYNPAAGMNLGFQQCGKCGWVDYGTYRYFAGT